MASTVAKVAALQVVRVLIALIVAWLATDLVCIALEIAWPRATDFVCGHNVFVQLPFLVIAVYLLLGLIPPLKLPKNLAEERQ